MTRYFLLSKYVEGEGQQYLADYDTKTGAGNWLPQGQKSDADRFPEALMQKLLAKAPELMFEATWTANGGGVE